MAGTPDDAATRRTPALTPQEASALRLARELRNRIQRERETAQLLSAYLEVSTADLDRPAVIDLSSEQRIKDTSGASDQW